MFFFSRKKKKKKAINLRVFTWTKFDNNFAFIRNFTGHYRTNFVLKKIKLVFFSQGIK